MFVEIANWFVEFSVNFDHEAKIQRADIPEEECSKSVRDRSEAARTELQKAICISNTPLNYQMESSQEH